MRQVKFKKAGMENYGPYIEPMELTINDNKLTLITGPNGIGKTMLLDVIPYTLYGATSKGMKGDDVVNLKTEKDCHTWLELTVDDIPYRLDRYHKYSKLGNTVILKKNGQEMKTGQKEVLPFIEELVAPFRLFTNTLLFGQKVKTFFTDLTDTEKKEIFRKILDLDEYTDFYNQTKEREKKAKLETTELEKMIYSSSSLISSYNSRLEDVKKEKEEFYTKKQNDILVLEKTISELNEKIELLKSGLEKLGFDQDKINKIKLLIQGKDSENISLNKDLYQVKDNVKVQRDKKDNELIHAGAEKLREIEKDHKTKLEILEKEHQDLQEQIRKDLNQLDGKELEVRKKIQTITVEMDHNKRLSKQLISDEPTCPTCLQPITSAAKQKIVSMVEYYENEIKKAIKEGSDLHVELAAIDNEKQKVKNFNRESDSTYNNKTQGIRDEFQKISVDLRKKLGEARTKLDKLEQEEVSKQTSDILKKKAKLESEIVNLSVELIKEEQKLSEYNNLKGDISYRENIISSKSGQLEQIKNQEYNDSLVKVLLQKFYEEKTNKEHLEKKLQDNKKELEILDFWKEGFSSTGIPSLLIDEAIPFMNRQVAGYLNQISNGRYQVSFDTMGETKAGEFRDKISVNVLDNVTKANNRVQLSGGQTRIVDIATVLTLSDLQSTIRGTFFNILLFDEIFDSLDDDNIGFVSNVLKKLVLNKSIFIISHRHIDQIEADETISLGR
jgi:DNA repair exonuclease SbcCD ATPase subunit